MKISKISDYTSYCQHLLSSQEYQKHIVSVENEITKKLQNNTNLYIKGYSWPKQSKSTFLLDHVSSNDGVINFRERLLCKKTQLNNRIRSSIHLLEDYFQAQLDTPIYLTEQCTPLGKWMQNKYPNLQASEYLQGISEENQAMMQPYIAPFQLQHQDLTDLSFNDNHFDFVLSFDCFEHIPDYRKAFQECFRVLKPNGKIMWTVPFDKNSESTLVRASLNEDGSIHHHCNPEYHGNPLSDEGCLSFYTFGWDLLSELKEMGFKKTYALLFWSEEYAYLGGEQIVFCGEK